MSTGWKDIVRAIAPTIGAVLGGPLAGGAIKVLADQFLGRPDATEEDIAVAIGNARPEDLIRLKEIEADYKSKMADLGLDPLRMEYADRASARDMFKVDNRPQRNITYAFLGGYFLTMLLIISAMLLSKELKVPTEFALVFGVITGAIPQILAFWFGSTNTSAQKNALLHASKPADAP